MGHFTLSEGAGVAAVLAVLGILASGWSQLKAFFGYLYSYVVVTLDLRYLPTGAVLPYLRRVAKPSRYGGRTYDGTVTHVRPAKRDEMVVWEDLSSKVSLFWVGWRPIWVREHKQAAGNAGGGSYGGGEETVSVSFFRWTFAPDTFLLAAVADYNERNHGKVPPSDRRRFFIETVSGRAKYGHVADDGTFPRKVSRYGCSSRTIDCGRLLGWQRSEIGPTTSLASAIDALALTPDLHALVREITHWKDNPDWFSARGLPWRRGLLAVGAPGSGKTSLVRAVAEDLDLPVFVFDLASLTNQELITEWAEMLAQTPCVALIEDIDATFDGRKNIAREEDGLTFDCLLNCLDGVRRADGLLLVITTNDASKIDPAVGMTGNDEQPTRPGRVDRIVVFGPLDEAGRKKLALRILSDYPELQNALVVQGVGDTGAQFQERCSRLALSKFWGE